MIIALLDDDDDDSEDDEASPRKRPESPCEMSLSGMKARVKEAADAIAKATKDLATVQKKKNAFCSLRRSKVIIPLRRRPATLTLISGVVYSRCVEGGFQEGFERAGWLVFVFLL